MSGRQKKVSETELTVLDVLWRRGRSTVRELTGEVYGEYTFSKYQSVQKLLERLEKKAGEHWTWQRLSWIELIGEFSAICR